MRILLSVFILMWGVAGHAETVRQMTVSAQGTVQAEPDMARIYLGVQTVGKTADAALDENSTKMQGIFDLLEGLKIEPRDIQTTNFSINPQWERIKAGSNNQQPKIIGYIVSNDIQLRIRDLDSLGGILDAVAGLGANSFRGIQFDVTDRAALLDTARIKAVETAKARAELLTKAAGVELGELISLSEGGGIVPQPRFARAEAMVADAVPIAQGELDITSTVTLTSLLE